MEDETQVAEATITDEELELDSILDGIEDVEALKEELAKKDKIVKQVLARAKAAEAKVKTAPQPIKVDSSTEDERLDLRLDGYSKDEVTFIMANGGRKVLDDKDSYVSIALNTKREQRAAEQAAGKTDDTSGMSPIERKYSPEALKNMSAADLEKILPRA